MSTGGTGHDILPQIHPDNALLAIRAAEALNLDLAGVDIISPDISVSWRGTGTKIIEVNAQPQISDQHAPDIYKNIVLSRLDGGRRAYVSLLIADEWDETTAAAFDSLSAAYHDESGVVIEQRPDGVYRSRRWIAPNMMSAIEFVQKAEWDRQVEKILAWSPLKDILINGLPSQFVDRLSVHFLAGSTTAENVRGLKRLLAESRGHLTDEVIYISASSECILDRARSLLDSGRVEHRLLSAQIGVPEAQAITGMKLSS